MTVTCRGYVVNGTGNGWRTKSAWDDTADLKASTHNHAERKVWRLLDTSGAYLLIQNAYPCADCHAFFLGESQNGHSVIIKVEGNQGAYSAVHIQNIDGKAVLNGPKECIIYYQAGQASFVTMSSVMAGQSGDAPANFPTIPDLPL